MPLSPDYASWNDFESRVAELFPPLSPGDGLPEADLIEAEQRLGFRLPGKLREYYRRTGRRGDLNHSFNRLAAPGALNVFGDVLVFYEESQNVIVWGIRLADIGQEDPPVLRSENQDELVWGPDHEHLSGFFVTMLYWQAANGGLPYVGATMIDETEIPAIRSHWKHVELRGMFWDQVFVFHRPGQVLCLAGAVPALELHAGARTREDFLEIQERLKVDWDYCSMNEDEEDVI
jgi:hypothetical protein